MEDSPARREAARPRRVSASSAAAAAATTATTAAAAAAAAVAAELGANVSLQDGEVIEVQPPPRETPAAADRLSAAGGVTERRNSAPLVVHQRHMPMEPNKFHIPRKIKEKKALHYVSTESREFEDMMTILTSSYIDTSSAGCFTYSTPRLVHSELLEKEFVEKRREMKAEGRTDKELEESYGFLLADTAKVLSLCEKGLCVGQSWMTVLGNPSKGVYLSRYSDLLQVNAIAPGATGEIIIFKVMKGKVKSIYENMKNLLDPTPRFDSHLSKNASKVTSLSSYRAFELTQQYFYEYSFDELRQRPRQVCPYAVVSFQFKGKDSSLPSKPLAPVRLNSQSAEGSKERAQFTVWTGDLVKGDRVLFQISLRSFSPPFLPHRLPEKLNIGFVMRLEQVTRLLPSGLFSYNLYNSSQEVVKNGHCCSLLEVVDRNRSTTSVTKLLQELEMKRVVLVTPLTDRGFLFLLSSVQMATATERGESWKRCLQALFVFPETRDVARSTSRCASAPCETSESLMSGAVAMPRLSQFIPALHHALVKARANPPPELSAGVERQAREYLTGLNDGKVRQYPMGEYDSKLDSAKEDERVKLFPAPKHHRVNLDGYLRSYLYSPAFYLLSVARAKQVVEACCGPEEPKEAKPRKSCGGQREATGKEATGNAKDKQINTQKLIDLVLTCMRNAENEVKREEGGEGGLKAPGRKRRLEQETAERTLKFLKASQEHGGHNKIPVEGSQVPASPGSLASVIGSLGLRDVDLREDGCELNAKLISLLTGINQAARGTASRRLCDMQEEAEQRESCPFDRLATRLGLPTSCDIDLRKQEELEEQTAGSVSSLEGFSPSSHSGEMNHHGAAGRGGGGGGGGGRAGLGRRAGAYEEEVENGEIPWILIPITGLCSERYTQRDRNIPQDPRFQHLTTATSITTTTRPPRKSPTLSPGPSPPSSPFHCPSPEPSPPPSPSQCPSPDPSPPPSPSQCPSPEPSPPPSPSQCPSPEPSPPASPSQCPSPQPISPPSPSQCTSPRLGPPPSPSRCQSPEPSERKPLNKGDSGANEQHLAAMASREFAGMSKDRPEKPQGREKKNEKPSIFTSIQPSVPPAPERRTTPSPPPSAQGKEDVEGEAGEVKDADVVLLEEEKETLPAEKVQKQAEEEVTEGKQDVEEVVDLTHDVAGEKEREGEVREPVGGSLFSPSVSSPPARPLRDIDSIVDKHLGDFSSEIQLLLQEESVHYSFPQSPHSTSNTDATALRRARPHASISPFSQYVSFYNPCPPVQDYVSSLQDSISSILTEVGDSWPSHKADSGRADTDVALASRVSAFVAGIRAGSGEPTAAASPSVSRTPALARGGEAWRPDALTRRFPGAANGRNPSAPHATSPGPTSASGSAHTPGAAAAHRPAPNGSPQSHWQPQQSHTAETSRTAAHNARHTQDNSVSQTAHCVSQTAHCATDLEGASGLAGSSFDVSLPGFSRASKPPAEPSEPVSSSASVSVPAPPALALSSLISQLQPEVFNSLEEIIKDVRKNSLQFYLHSTEPGDRVYEDVREQLLKQGNVEQSPVAFLNQDNSDNRLLVIVKNKDIAGHIHQIPSLVGLKRHPSVVFVGIDTLDDIANNSYNELFVSGGCVVSDEVVLSPDFITHGQLAELLMLLEQHSSLESVWRWKIHCKTHKKLKEQARFRRDAANILDVLSAYQKRQIVEFLPYHHCDMMNQQSPDLNCLIELQARYTQYRHTIFLTELRSEKIAAYSSCGIIVAGIEEILHSFTRLVGYHDIKDKQPIMDDLLATKGLGDPERSPAAFPEHAHPLSSCSSGDPPQLLLQQPGSGLLPLPHLSDQLVPDASCKDGAPPPSDTDYEVLRLAISQFRAARRQQQQQQQQQRLDSQAESSISPLKGFLPHAARTGSGCTASPSVGQGAPTESAHLNPGRKAVAATLELIHSALQQELGEEDGAEPLAEREGYPGKRGGLAGGKWGPSRTDASPAPPSNQSTATVAGPSECTDSASVGRETENQQGEPAFPKAAQHVAASRPAEGDRPRNSQSVQEQRIGDGAPPGNGKVAGSVTMVTGQEGNASPAPPRRHQIQQPQQHLQHPSSHPPQQQWGGGLLQTPPLPRLPGQPFPPGPMLRPLPALGGIRGLLGPTPVWPGGLSPAGAAALVWGFQQAGTGPGPALLGGYHNPAGQGSNRYRGGQRGGFNGM